MESTIRSDLRFIIAKYGLQNVHRELQQEMRETYDFLRNLYEPPKNNLVIPVAEVIPDRIASPKLNNLPNVFISDVPELELSGGIIENNEDTHSLEEKESLKIPNFPSLIYNIPKDPNVKEIHIQSKKENETPQETPDKFTKQKHKEEVLKKKKELEEKGIKPESLLTKENLEKWLGEGLSYMRIAREKVGMHENEISAIAKTLGLQSSIKRYIVMKKGGNK